MGSNRILGYDSEDGKLVPNEDAEIVKIIFQLYLEGKGCKEIADNLNSLGMTGRRGNGCMSRTIRETDLIAAICIQMDWEKFDEERFEKEVERVVVTDEEVVIAKTGIEKFTAQAV